MFSYFWGSTKNEAETSTRTTTTTTVDTPTVDTPTAEIDLKQKKQELVDLIQNETDIEKINAVRLFLKNYTERQIDDQKISINIRQFSPDKIHKNFVAISIGKTAVGKTTLNNDLMKKSNLDYGLVINPTNQYDRSYTETKTMKVLDEYTPEILKEFLDDLRVTRKEQPDSRRVLVLDDCFYDTKSWTQDKSIKQLFMNGRHLGSTMLWTQQYVMGIPPNLRTNIDYIFIFKEPKRSNRQKLYEHYAGMFPNFEMFSEVLNSCTQNYGCLVINNTSTSSKLEDQVFWYKAECPTIQD